MKKTVLTVMCLLLSLVLTAGNVTEQEALRKAQQLMQDKQLAQPKTLHRSVAPSFADGAFYVFNAEGEQGFVIVSADDRTHPILGYSDEGRLDLSNLPDNARTWLEGYARAIKALAADTTNAPEAKSIIWGNPISPMVTCKWSQEAPYNLMCPMDTDEKGQQVHCATGCSATAMAELMFYHQLDTTTKPLPAYTTKTKGIQVEALPAHTFQWSKMRAEYQATDTDEGALEMARLMRYCGQSINMDYTAESSGQFPTVNALVNIFGYSNQAREVFHADYTLLEWEKMVYDELAAKRPVLYFGDAIEGPHEFIIDGYDDKGLYHVNWGWGGQLEGYFVLSLLNPNKTKNITGVISEGGYSGTQCAIIGIEKPKEGETAVLQRIYAYPTWPKDNKEMNYSRGSAAEDFQQVVFSFMTAYMELKDGESVNVDYALNVYNNGQLVMRQLLAQNLPLTKDYKLVENKLNFGKDLQDGLYEIHLVVSRSGENKWLTTSSTGVEENLNYERTYVAYITDKGTKLSVFPFFYTPNDENIKLTNLQCSSHLMKGRTGIITLDCTNYNYTNEVDLYLYIKPEKTQIGTDGNTYKIPVGKLSLYINYGETGQGTIWFTPSNAGQNVEFYICPNNFGYYPIYSGTMNIAEPHVQLLTAKSTVDGITKDMLVNSTAISGKIAVENAGSFDYDDFVAVCLAEVDPKDYNIILGDVVESRQELKLAPGTKTDLPFNFSNLQPGKAYEVYLKYYSLPQNEQDTSKDDHYSGVTLFGVSPSASAIDPVTTGGEKAAAQYFSLDGHRLSTARQGVSIVRTADGNSRKVVVK